MMIVNIDFIASFFDIENNYFNIKKGSTLNRVGFM